MFVIRVKVTNMLTKITEMTQSSSQCIICDSMLLVSSGRLVMAL